MEEWTGAMAWGRLWGDAAAGRGNWMWIRDVGDREPGADGVETDQAVAYTVAHTVTAPNGDADD